jgi:hypothetical protein
MASKSQSSEIRVSSSEFADLAWEAKQFEAWYDDIDG